jgi:nucleoid-associated protein YgaU
MKAVLEAAKLETSLFPATSRYYGVETTTIETADEKTVVYLRRRFVPPPERFELIQEHTVTQGDRLDNIAASYLGDPEQFWRIADANSAMKPEDLTEEVGRKLRITQPEGIPGAQYA